MIKNGTVREKEWRNSIKRKHKAEEAIVYHEKKYFRLPGAEEYFLGGPKFRERKRTRARLDNYISELAIKNNKKLKKGSQRYEKLLAAIVAAYARVLTSVIIDTVLKGDRLFIGGNLMSFHIFNVPAWFKELKLPYRYHRKLDGAFPVLKVGLQKRRLTMISRSRNIKRGAFYITGGISRQMSGMITHKIINEKSRYSDNPLNEFVKEKKIIKNAK